MTSILNLQNLDNYFGGVVSQHCSKKFKIDFNGDRTIRRDSIRCDAARTKKALTIVRSVLAATASLTSASNRNPLHVGQGARLLVLTVTEVEPIGRYQARILPGTETAVMLRVFAT
jgi:hypothetical protein